MRKHGALLAGVLLVAAPLFSQPAGFAEPVVENGVLHWFHLTETRAEVSKLLGPPKVVSALGDDLELWQYQIGVAEDDEEFSHHLVFRRSTGKLISASRNFETDRDVEWLFAGGRDSVYWFTGNEGARYGFRVLQLADDRLIVVPGSSAPGKPASRIMLIRRSELKYFFPWLDGEMNAQAAAAVQ